MKNPYLDNETSLATRAAWLHFVGGHKQSAVAKILGVPSVKAHRLISKAVADGLVKVSIDSTTVECVKLENQLAEKYDLKFCEIAPDLFEDGLPLLALGSLGASYIQRQIELKRHKTFGLSHGRTIAAAVEHLARIDAKHVQFVSLLGTLTREFVINPNDVMHAIAEKTQTRTHVLPIPFYANSNKDREVLLDQKGVKAVFDLAENTTLKFVGIGPVGIDSQLVQSGMIERHEIEDIIALGGVAELLGRFYDKTGNRIETTLTERTIAVSVEGEASGEIVAIAGGEEKLYALSAVLNSGQLSGLLTDEKTARLLL